MGWVGMGDATSGSGKTKLVRYPDFSRTPIIVVSSGFTLDPVPIVLSVHCLDPPNPSPQRFQTDRWISYQSWKSRGHAKLCRVILVLSYVTWFRGLKPPQYDYIVSF